MKTIGIIGFGMVGRAIQHGFAQICDFRIYDIDPIISENTFEETIRESDYIFICVPTPMKKDTGEGDISIVRYTIEKARAYLTPKKILVIKSTIPIGTTKKIQKELPHLRIVFNPEFLTARTSRLDFINTSRIILGGNKNDIDEIESLYRLRFKHTPIYKTDPTTAEMVKYAANCFFSVKVSLFNEYYQICDKLGIDFDEMIKMLAADGRIGNSHLNVPGHDGDFGFGGLCFPKDINALIFKAKELGIDPKLLEAAWKKNLEVRKKKDWHHIKGAISGSL
jgi:UDPglucose 6-dehydrogenase